MNVFVLLNTKEDILKNVGNREVSGAPLTSIMFFFPTMKVIDAPKQPGCKLSPEYLCVQNKEIHTGLELLEGE